ncbi:MAG: hypothetical protein ACHP7E_07740, partial [Burkholderiales bacterium]
MPVYVAARRHRHGDRAQQHADETGEAEEASGALDGVAQLRTRIRDVAQALPGALVGAQPELEAIDTVAFPREQP